MRIKEISVNGLFGILDHVIPLNIEERITIIHGLNGFGKTNILKFIDGIFNSNYQVFKSIPFEKILIEFNNKSKLEIQKSLILIGKDKFTVILVKLIKIESEDLDSISLDSNKNDRFLLLSGLDMEQQDNKILSLTKINEKEWTNEQTNQTYQFSFIDILSDELKKRFNNNQFNDSIFKDWEVFFEQAPLEPNLPIGEKLKLGFKNTFQEKSWFRDLKNDIKIRLVESQRLLNIRESNSPSIFPTVATYSNEIAELMQDKFSEYGKISQSLDRTFPLRAVQQKGTGLTDEELREELSKLEQMRSRLIELGLLDQEENPDFPNQLQHIDKSTRNILSVYVDDVKNKLSVFDKIASKIELLKTIINRKFAYSFKKLSFSKEQGFIFTNIYPNYPDEYPKTLSSQDLSSGEQHELVLLYELLFKVEPGSLVLIDEPELSLHVGWQSEFIEDLKAITKLADIDILMATHSPDIIQEHWDDLTVELKAPEK
ncbi:MAG: AAA family ATPase [Cyanobacteria bacterium P01_F01_bin.143]